MGDIIIRDDTLGYSKSYPATEQGYRDAQNDIVSLRQQGRIVSGDVGRVEGYTGGEPRKSTFSWF